MKNRYLVLGLVFLIGAFTLWQFRSAIGESNSEALPVLTQFFSKFENKSASADADVLPSEKVASTITEKYQHYRDCMEASTPCKGFVQSSPDAYLSDVRNQMISDLKTHYEKLRAQTSTLTSEDQTLARDLVTDATPDAQIVGLEILDLCSPSEMNLEAIATLMTSAFDDGVVSVAGDSLLNYRSESRYSADITKAFLAQIGLGVSDQAALAAIEKLPPFLNDQNIGEFRALRDQLKEMSEKQRLQTRRYKALDAVVK